MAAADHYACDQHIAMDHLMERAGERVAAAVERWAQGPINVHILAGPGNNGGDAFVAARYLAARRYAITLDFWGDEQKLSPSARAALERYKKSGGKIREGERGGREQQTALAKTDLIIDGLLGAGLNRPLTGPMKSWVQAINQAEKPVIAIDMPTGVSGDSGEIMGEAITASQTITFFRAKPGHHLYPGKSKVGELHVEEIGIPDRCLPHLAVNHWQNHPSLWQTPCARESHDVHKYQNGSVLVIGGAGNLPGASALAANAALRAGAGLVTVCHAKNSPPHPGLYAAVMTTEHPKESQWASLVTDKKIGAILFGPGAQPNTATKKIVEEITALPCHICLDAGALTAFEQAPEVLSKILQAAPQGPSILTPHQGEFDRLFNKDKQANRLTLAQKAAKDTKSIIVLKGASTIIAAPTGETIINDTAPKTLATAGTGDVLAGMIAASCAQGLSPLKAAACAVYLHGEAAKALKAELVADDLLPQISKLRGQFNGSEESGEK